MNEPFCDILGDLVGGFVFVEITVQRLHAHVTAVRNEVGDGMVGFIQAELDVGLHPGHSLGDGVGIFTLVTETVQARLKFSIQLGVLVLAIDQSFF